MATMTMIKTHRTPRPPILLAKSTIGHCKTKICKAKIGNRASIAALGSLLKQSKKAGFTLVEMIVALAVLSILLGIAVPAIQNMLRSARITSQANDFVAALYLTRSEALKRGAATICPSTNGLNCAGGTSWENGWLVFADANANGVVNSGEAILRATPALSGANTLRSGARIRVTYHRDGYPQGFNDSFRVCDARGIESARTVVLSNVGRIRTTVGASTCP